MTSGLDPTEAAWRAAAAAMLLGTAQGASAPQLPGGLAAVSAGEGASGVLGALAATATYRRAAAEAHGGLVEFPAVNEAHPECSAVAADLLALIVGSEGGAPASKDSRATLLQLWLEAASNSGRRVPPEMVPLLLERFPGVVSAPAAQRALGERDRWLQSLIARPTAGEAQWLAGGIPERLRQLMAWRTKDPAAAREALADAWASEAAEARAAFVGALAVGLSQADEAFLEVALDDRSGRVRNGAIRLLVNVPESAFAARSEARARQAVSLKRSLLPGAAAKFDIRMPTVDAAMRRDGIGIAERAKGAEILEDVVALAPTRAWSDHEPSDWMAAAMLDAEHGPALVEGWVRMSERDPERRWPLAAARTLLLEPTGGPDGARILRALLNAISAIRSPAGEAEIKACIAKRDLTFAVLCLGCCRWDWTPSFTAFALRTLDDNMAELLQRPWSYRFNQLDRWAAPACEPMLRDLAARVEGAGNRPGTGHLAAELLRFADVLRLRAAIADELGVTAAAATGMAAQPTIRTSPGAEK